MGQGVQGLGGPKRCTPQLHVLMMHHYEQTWCTMSDLRAKNNKREISIFNKTDGTYWQTMKICCGGYADHIWFWKTCWGVLGIPLHHFSNVQVSNFRIFNFICKVPFFIFHVSHVQFPSLESWGFIFSYFQSFEITKTIIWNLNFPKLGTQTFQRFQKFRFSDMENNMCQRCSHILLYLSVLDNGGCPLHSLGPRDQIWW